MTLPLATVAQSPCRVAAIVVTYGPALPALHQQLMVLEPQVDDLIVVNNGISETLAAVRAWAITKIHTLQLTSNLGVGAAHNRGIEQARTLGATHVLLMDQDSIPAPDMVAQLKMALQRLSDSCKLAAVGPCLVLDSGAHSVDAKRDAYFLAEHEGAVVRVHCRQNEVQSVDALISSGSLLPLSVLDAVGGMDESLFIDAVDTEWCLRARAHGFSIFAVGAARLEHRLGEASRRVWLGRWRWVPLHSPLRSYTIVRNSFLLSQLTHVSPAWRRYFLRMVIRRFGYFLLFGPQRLRQLKAMWLGGRDGLAGRRGSPVGQFN